MSLDEKIAELKRALSNSNIEFTSKRFNKRKSGVYLQVVYNGSWQDRERILHLCRTVFSGAYLTSGGWAADDGKKHSCNQTMRLE